MPHLRACAPRPGHRHVRVFEEKEGRKLENALFGALFPNITFPSIGNVFGLFSTFLFRWMIGQVVSFQLIKTRHHTDSQG